MADEEDFGEGGKPGEDRAFFGRQPSVKEEVITDRRLAFEEASRCLNTLGKDESGCRYAYLRLTASAMKLTDVAIILKFKHVLFLDLSENYLTIDALQVLTAMPYLILLKADRNRIESISLNSMPFLQVLNFNENQITQTTALNQPLLDCLQLNFNSVYIADFAASQLESLKQLEMRSNLLFELSGVYPPTIEKLYLAANKINSINGDDFAALTELKVLHLRDNLLEKLDGFSASLKSLKYLNLRSNKIKRMKEFLKLQCLPALETLVVSGNPLVGFEEQQGGEGGGGGGGEAGEGGEEKTDMLVVVLLALLPNLKRVNKTAVSAVLKIKANDVGNEVLDAILYGNTMEESDMEATTTDLTSEYKTGESESERGEEIMKDD